jgi:hypothetical protein
MIGLEALFLGGSDSPFERSELRFRLSLRVSRYLGRTAANRHVFFALVQRLYDARSALVHGGTPSPRVLRRPDGSDGSLTDSVVDADGVLRRALAKVIRSEPPTRGPAVDWDVLVLGKRP